MRKIALNRLEFFRTVSGLNAGQHRSGLSNPMYARILLGKQQNPDCAVCIAVKRASNGKKVF